MGETKGNVGYRNEKEWVGGKRQNNLNIHSFRLL